MVVGMSRFGKPTSSAYGTVLTLLSETVKRVLKFPPDTNIVWRSHDESIEQRKVADEARQQQGTRPGVEKRRTSLYAEDLKGKASS